MKTLEVLFTPADFTALQRRNLDNATGVVLDVFRATSSMVTALANGAVAILPVAEISEALAAQRQSPDVLLAGERDGLRIHAGLTGGVNFDLGNSPREFTRERVSGKTIVMTTTNGTRALRACAHAERVFIGSFLNLKATADFIAGQRPEHLLIVCSGTLDQAAYEDVLAAGALCEQLWSDFVAGEVSDSALLARRLFQSSQPRWPEEAIESRNARRLLGIPQLREDVAFCLRQNAFGITAALGADGKVKIVQAAVNLPR
jgi:2-phosphosulfolactate phosphatase